MIDTLKWSRIECEGSLPCRRNMHAAEVIQGGQQLIVMGGATNGDQLADSTSTLQLYKLDLQAKQWSHVECNGQIPANRFGMSCIKYGNKLLMFGGMSTGGQFFNDVNVLDTGNYVQAVIIPIGYI